MARIRTVKPDLFRHEDLYEAEKEYGLPIRLAFIALFTACDREGRFKWRPRQLKLDCLPYDEIDFSRVLHALSTRGFIKKYSVCGVDYGVIPSFSRHQIVNNREAQSELPAPEGFEPAESQNLGNSDSNLLTPSDFNGENIGDTGGIGDFKSGELHENDASATRHDLAQAEREGKGRERERERKGKDAVKGPRQKTMLPTDFTISESVCAWYVRQGFLEPIQNHLDSFMDKCKAKGYSYADWNAAFQNAIREDWAGLRKNNQQSQQIKPAPQYIPPEQRGGNLSVIDSTAKKI